VVAPVNEGGLQSSLASLVRRVYPREGWRCVQSKTRLRFTMKVHLFCKIFTNQPPVKPSVLPAIWNYTSVTARCSEAVKGVSSAKICKARSCRVHSSNAVGQTRNSTPVIRQRGNSVEWYQEVDYITTLPEHTKVIRHGIWKINVPKSGHLVYHLKSFYFQRSKTYTTWAVYMRHSYIPQNYFLPQMCLYMPPPDHYSSE